MGREVFRLLDATIAQLTKERDAARTDAVDNAHEAGKMLDERNALRAEVDRLRTALWACDVPDSSTVDG